MVRYRRFFLSGVLIFGFFAEALLFPGPVPQGSPGCRFSLQHSGGLGPVFFLMLLLAQGLGFGLLL